MEKLIYPPTGNVISVEAGAVERMLKGGFVRPTAPQAEKKTTKANTKSTKKA